jgi:hypothetical protein
MDGWMPIETAPRDTEILLAWWATWPERGWKIESGWAGRSNSCHPDSGASNGWLHGTATHWQPLPPPPSNP